MVSIKNRGAALVTVLVIVVIVMVIIANLTVTNYRMIKRLENRQLIEQATSIAYSAVDFGRAGLATSGATQAFDALTDIWAQPFPKTKVLDDVYMSGYVIDEQSKFNLNDLVNRGVVNKNVLTQFSQLLGYLNLPQSLAYNIAFYIASPVNQNDIMLQYTMGKPAYRPAGRPFVDLSELILVKGTTPEIVQKLAQYTTAIPVNGYGLTAESAESAVNYLQNNLNFGFGQAVNVNTAPAEVIAAKGGISMAIAQRMVSARLSQPFKNSQAVTTFLTQNGVNLNPVGQSAAKNGTQVNTAGLVTSSSYFSIHVTIDDYEDQFRWVAFVYRQNRSGQWPQILWQHPE